MLTKIPKKGLNAVLIISILGLGTGYNLPTVYAEANVSQVNETANTLSKLEIEGIKLDKEFSADINQYSATIENETDSIQIFVQGGSDNSIISINDKTVKSGAAESYSLQTGQNLFLITVKDLSSNLKNTYSLTVTRKQNNNNQLQDLKLSAGKLSPAFSSEVTDYSLQLTNSVKELVVLSTAEEKTAEIEVNGVETTQKGVKVNVPVGKSDIRIVVTAENGSKLRYSIHVDRKDTSSKNGTVPAQNGSSLPTKTSTSVPVQNGSGFSTKTSTSIPVQTTRTNQNSIQNASIQPSAAGAAGTAQKTSKATLSKLTVSEGTWDSSFNSSEYTYHVAVPSDTKTVTINPAASFSSSEIKIEDGISNTIQLDSDNKTVISIRVTYDDSDRKTYVLVFDREEK
ncbi:cadherin-like beta sandwich domain-containing protein [Neobacillus vireti]|uniref:cadherin-like beta sandwich domain-containing protein n=1 Tax=Neobacillus vireti TaxID=220686 RepID=UPI002FFFB44D